jgi:hypothetical protein
VISTVPLSATAQLLLPGTDAVAAPVQLMVPFDARLAVAVPLPLIGTAPLHVAEKFPETDVAVTLAIVHENPPHVPACAPADCVDENVPAFRLVLRSDDAEAAGEGAVAGA